MGVVIESFGANGEVTGSCHLLTFGGSYRVLVDCGLFQGPRSRAKNEPPFPFDPGSIDVLIVTHAHLDHIGRIPLLVKEGFRGQILSNRATFELSRLSLLDSVAVMASDARRAEARRQRNGARDEEAPIRPLFNEDELFQALDRWDSHLSYGRPRRLTNGLELTLSDAGHILGSASLLFESTLGEATRVAISGDLGNQGKPLVHDPAHAPKADLALVEATYGDRDHRSFQESVAEMEEVIRTAFQRGGNVVIPTFALERAQELLFILFEAIQEKRIPGKTRIFLDSPLAINATGIYRRHLGLFHPEAKAYFTGRGKDPFGFKNLTYTRSTQESMAINAIDSHAVILAGSGMVTGGRIIDHLRHQLPRKECSVVFMGYQAEGTTGRGIVDGAKVVRLHGREVEARAHIHTIGGFSAHGGQSSLLRWALQTEAREIYLVHGEERGLKPLAKLLEAEGVTAHWKSS